MDYISALDLIHKRLSDPIDITMEEGAFLKADLAGLLIDIGAEGQIKEPILEGLEIFQKDRKPFCKFIREYSLEYNIGNAKSGLFKIQRMNPSFKFSPESIAPLVEAKNHFWRAYKLMTSKDKEIRLQLLVNLANTLDTSGRVVEALHYYDQVLKEDLSFPQANACRGQALIWLNHLSGSYTKNLLWQAMNGFGKAVESINAPKVYIEDWGKKRDWLQTKLTNLGYGNNDIEHDLLETKAEYESHSDYRKFCLNNCLCLSEHSLYCNCIGASRDNLIIPMTIVSIGGEYIPQMELRLNRIKSEFALARLLYYESSEINKSKWNLNDQEVLFTELYEGESIGLQPEMLRTSFRLCFGILDKIAHAICELFDLSDSNELIYFEKFWRPRGKNLSCKQNDRWSKINSIDNFPFLALYCQATDLNSETGEWSDFKNWRNALEHEILVLTISSQEPLDIYKVLKNSRHLICVEYQKFRDTTFHLLQLTRSAIFNFVFCVRTEGIKEVKEYGIQVNLTPKIKI